MESINNINFRNLKIDQLGYVYKDAEKQAKIMEETFGMPKFAFMEGTHEIEYRGKKTMYSTKIGISRLFNTQIELIQWVNGEGVHKEFITNGKEGLQHISFFVDDIEPYIKDFEKRGFEVIQAGQIGKQKFAYMNTEKAFGLIIEFQMTLKRNRKRK
ncbi:MAG: VOC family protein [Promethearchaeota archaeon]